MKLLKQQALKWLCSDINKLTREEYVLYEWSKNTLSLLLDSLIVCDRFVTENLSDLSAIAKLFEKYQITEFILDLNSINGMTYRERKKKEEKIIQAFETEGFIQKETMNFPLHYRDGLFYERPIKGVVMIKQTGY